jgi:hypothetical protein
MTKHWEYRVIRCCRVPGEDGGLGDWTHMVSRGRRGIRAWLRGSIRTRLVGVEAILDHYAAQGWELVTQRSRTARFILWPPEIYVPIIDEVEEAELVLRRSVASWHELGSGSRPREHE